MKSKLRISHKVSILRSCFKFCNTAGVKTTHSKVKKTMANHKHIVYKFFGIR